MSLQVRCVSDNEQYIHKNKRLSGELFMQKVLGALVDFPGGSAAGGGGEGGAGSGRASRWKHFSILGKVAEELQRDCQT